MTNDEKRAWELAEKISVCLLVTQTDAGMHARPMTSIPREDEGRIYFLTERKASADKEIGAEGKVLLGYGDGSSKYLSVSGTAGESADRTLIKRLWNGGAQAFWPNGPEDPNIVALVVVPEQAEFWDGANSLVATVKMAYAMATGERPDLGDKRTVPMGRH